MKRTVMLLAALSAAFLFAACGIEDEQSLEDREEIKTEVIGEVIPEDQPMEIEIEVEEPIVREESYLTAELQRVADAAAILEDSINNGNLTQTQLNTTSGDLYKLWDDELNDLWKRLKSKLSDSEMKKLLSEQRTWIANKEKQVKKAGDEVRGGSMQPMVEDLEAAKLTRERVIELAVILGNAEGITVFAPVSSETVEADKLLEGKVTYVDRQGTNDVYSFLDVEDNGDDTYKVDISIFRLYDFENGEGVKSGDKVYVTFKVDEDTTFRGSIAFEGEGAVFTAEEDFYSLIGAGEKFTFDEKM